MLHRCVTNRFVTNIIRTQRSFSTFYTKEHEWISISDKQATIGISDYAQSQLGGRKKRKTLENEKHENLIKK